MKKLAFAAALAAALSVTQVSAHSWVAASGGAIPHGATVAGTATDGEPLFACRAGFEDGIHIGKLRKAFGGCNIPWGGKERTVKSYEVLVSHD